MKEKLLFKLQKLKGFTFWQPRTVLMASNGTIRKKATEGPMD